MGLNIYVVVFVCDGEENTGQTEKLSPGGKLGGGSGNGHYESFVSCGLVCTAGQQAAGLSAIGGFLLQSCNILELSC